MTVPLTFPIPYSGSYLTPAYEEATVGEAMRPGVLACPADSSVVDVARVMASNHVHCVVLPQGTGWALVTSRAVLESAVRDDGATAAEIAIEAMTVTARDPLARAAARMVETGAEHALVVDSGGRPVGVLSSLDVAGIVAWGRG